MNKFSGFFKTLSFIAILVCACFAFQACHKDGELIEGVEVFNFRIDCFTANPDAAFEVSVNNELVTDSLMNGVPKSKVVTLVEGKQHVVIKKSSSKTVLIDTLITVTDKQSRLTVLQLDEEAKPILVGKSDQEIPANSRSIAFYYTDDVLPDSMGYQLYACYYDENTFELKRVDTLATYDVIRKGQLSEFEIVKDSIDFTTLYFMQPLDVKTGEALENLALPFDPMNYSGFDLGMSPGPTGKEQNYINLINGYKQDGTLSVTLKRLLSY